MRNFLKRFLCIVFVVCLCLGSEIPYLCQVESVQASSQRDKNVKKIASLLSDGIYYQISYNMRPNLECISDFSKNSECKVYMTTSNAITASTFTKNVFGKKISGAKINYGDWGQVRPELKVTKIKTKGKKLEVSYKMWSIEEDEYGTRKNLVASGTMYLKKSNVSKYKYAVTKLSIKRNDYRFYGE